MNKESMLSGIKRWLRPKTEDDKWRTIDINLKIATFNVCLSIVALIVVIILGLIRQFNP